MKNRIRRVLALVEDGPDHVCGRYRILAFGPAWAEAGWHLEVRALARGTAPFLRQLPAIAQADAVILQRKLPAVWKTWLLRKAAKRLVYDFDDAMLFRDFNSAKSPESWRGRRRFSAVVRAADAVVAGNAFLAERAAECGASAERISIVPTCVEPEHYRPARHVPLDGPLRVVWIGSRSTSSSLVAMGEHLRAGAERCDLEVRVVCDVCPTIPGVRTVFCPWSPVTEIAEPAQSHVGISWLPEHPFSQGKCGLKVLQYMAAGLPTIANPFGVHGQMIGADDVGFLASSPSDWGAAIERLARSHRLRAELGQAARRRVFTDYSVAAWAPRWIELLDRLYGKARASEPVEAASCHFDPSENAASTIGHPW
jgi:glycosyltransferase involved in cell wall biosynthesis